MTGPNVVNQVLTVAATPRHELVEMMALRWDELGHRPPRNWRWICTCGRQCRSLPDQLAAFDSWREHRCGGDE